MSIIHAHAMISNPSMEPCFEKAGGNPGGDNLSNNSKITNPLTSKSATSRGRNTKGLFSTLTKDCLSTIGSGVLNGGFIKPLEIVVNMFIKDPLKLCVVAVLVVGVVGNCRAVESNDPHESVNGFQPPMRHGVETPCCEPLRACSASRS